MCRGRCLYVSATSGLLCRTVSWHVKITTSDEVRRNGRSPAEGGPDGQRENATRPPGRLRPDGLTLRSAIDGFVQRAILRGLHVTISPEAVNGVVVSTGAVLTVDLGGK